MLKYLTVLFLCLLPIKQSFSQFVFTQNGDTLVALNEVELDSVISTYIQLDACKEVSDTLQSQINLLRLEISALESVLALDDRSGQIKDELIATLKKQNKELIKTIRKEKRKSFGKGFLWGAATLAVVEIVIVAVLR